MSIDVTQSRPQALRERFHSVKEGGLDFRALPMRLFIQGNQKFWDPSDIDFSQDAEHWQLLNDEQKEGVLYLAVNFVTGEEAVTEDIVPFIKAMADEGRLEDELYLTQFAFEEAKHTEVFRRWLNAVGVDKDLHYLIEEDVQLTQSPTYIFTHDQPEVMQRLWTDPSPEAQIRANVIYNQYVEGTLALTGYWLWAKMLDSMGGLFPGMREIVRRISTDERRHLAWGTYNIRRHVAADPAMWDVAKAYLDELKEKMTEREFENRRLMEEQAEAEGITIESPFGITEDERWDYQLSRLERRYGAISSALGADPERIDHDLEESDEDEDEGYASLAQ